MRRFQDIWQEQCEAAQRVFANHGRAAALDYLVGEKLMTYVATAEEHPKFARELPKFVARVRDIFGTAALSEYVTSLDEGYREGEQAARDAMESGNDEDAELFDKSEEWIIEASRLARIRELLTVERLGTA